MNNYMKVQRGRGGTDEWMTPDYAVEPIAPYLRSKATVLCPFDLRDSAFARVLRKHGFRARTGHISTGKDFFALTRAGVAGVDCIVSNPPYSKKDAVFEHLFTLGKPFAMLMGSSSGLFEGKRFDLFAKHTPEVMWLAPRINFIDADGTPCKSPVFQSCYVCWHVLPQQIMFRRVARR